MIKRRGFIEIAAAALVLISLSLAKPESTFGQADPASEPAVLAVAKVLPAVVNINTERVVRRQVRDPFDDFAAQFFGTYRNRRPREIRQTLQSLGTGFLVDPAGFIVTNEHVVERAADLKIEVITNDSKSYKARYITGDSKEIWPSSKSTATSPCLSSTCMTSRPIFLARPSSLSATRSATAARSAGAC
jgi:S1-C subfamily serine protease